MQGSKKSFDRHVPAGADQQDLIHAGLEKELHGAALRQPPLFLPIVLLCQIHGCPELSRQGGVKHRLPVVRCTGGVKIIPGVKDILKGAGRVFPGKTLVKAKPLPLHVFIDAQIAILGKRELSPCDRIFANSVHGLLLSSKHPSRPI